MSILQYSNGTHIALRYENADLRLPRYLLTIPTESVGTGLAPSATPGALWVGSPLQYNGINHSALDCRVSTLEW